MPTCRLLPMIAAVATGVAGVVLPCGVARSDDGFNPFGQLDQGTPTRKHPAASDRPDDAPAPSAAGEADEATPSRPYVRPPALEAASGVERGELAPIIASDGSGLPFELWRGLDLTALEGQLSRLDIPPRSPAVHDLWRRLITSNVTPPDGGQVNGRFNLLRADVLYRSGLLAEAAKALEPDGGPADAALRAIVAARIAIGLNQTERACIAIKGMQGRNAELSKPMRSEALLIAGICAAEGGNPGGAGLVADLAREEKSDDASSLAILDAIAGGSKTPVRGLKAVSLLVYRALSFAGGVDAKDAIEHGEPALLVALAQDTTATPDVRLAAAEAAARVNGLTPDSLAAVYRESGGTATVEALLATSAAGGDAPRRRAELFKAAEIERTPLKKVRLMRALLDEARRSGLYLQTLAMLAKPAEAIQPVPEIGWFAESGVEIGLASGSITRARQWAALGGAVPGDNGLRHWLALIDLADPQFTGDRGRNLAALEDLAARGRLTPDLLQRLATVLDANDINVPIPLWEAASRGPQSTAGFLPETGVLTDLQDAAKKKEFGRTVLLVMRALGKSGAEGANVIALGDSIRALRRAGLDADARRLSIEALFAEWPRNVTN